MTRLFRRSAAALALLASVSMAATPAMARGWGGGWGRHHDDVDAGDVITGILIIGGIAAIASAANSDNKRERERREREEREAREAREYRYDQAPSGYGEDSRPEWRGDGSGASAGAGGINAAIDRCVGEIERGSTRVEEVETVGRQGNAWRVEGRVQGGQSFACTVDREGRLRNVSVGGEAF